MCYVGINIGALTVKVVALRGADRTARVVAHQGRPRAALDGLLAEEEFDGAAIFGVSGQMGHISEVAAIQRALNETGEQVEAVASLGGESFLVYIVRKGRLDHVLSHNKCAAGSGEFFVQQIGRMGLGLDDAIRLSFGGKVVPLASRCSVHCKSDITHKLNRKEAAPEDILHTLHDSMASKVAALLEKTRRPLRRVLLIGGVTRNAAMVAALREKLPGTELVVLPESPWFEAWGTALLARDDPREIVPRMTAPPVLDPMPPLQQYSGRVEVIPSPPLQHQQGRPLALGVDAGSTTTKIALVDPMTRRVVASHYTRTRGDPVAATRSCLRALAGQEARRPIGRVAATGSARELVGAYLGTPHVYNEISAHAAGAAHFDPDVDTIFEIGGQDSKYIYLRNGVPVDYAMNNACSAGTGSFLEESAQSDLGLRVSEISDIALAAAAPVRFKATCAAFINSDIRIAQQRGHGRDDIVAGLVYAIADNYLKRVKGSRPIGKKVFLQGGVALNHAVGHAFAQSIGRLVVIPPNPEMLGALGVALLAIERAQNALEALKDLEALADPELRLVGHFTCGACSMYCGIDRFEVAGRRFPFGGRCSLYENVWKRKSRICPAPDLVEQRAAMVFGSATTGPAPAGIRVGIPRALTAHSLYPLYATFFSSLGMEVVLSEVNPRGDLKSYSGFCFPAQIAHGAVLDLVRRGVNLVFLPHVVRMPRATRGQESYLCPITQAGPYFLAKAFPEIRFLSPELDFSSGYESCSVMIDMALRELDLDREQAERAWSAAVRSQLAEEQTLHDLGRRAMEKAAADPRPVIVLAGHSYNAFAPEASQSIARKLSSMGVAAVPADCLTPVEEGPTPWHFANQILNATTLVKRQPNLFLLCVSNFSCTIDAFTQALLASRMGQKPYLVLEIDAHTADAGVQTRLEAFLEIIQNYRAGQTRSADSFVPCRLGGNGEILRSNGERVPLTDPRVRVYFPTFSDYHAQSMALATRWLGLKTGDNTPLDRGQLERGLQYTSGRECLPLPICVGQLLYAHEHRKPGEIVAFYMARGGAPCVLAAYYAYFERFIAEQRLADLFMMDPGPDNDYLGFDEATLARNLSPAITVADLLMEIEEVLRVAGAPGTAVRLKNEWRAFVGAARSLEEFDARLPEFVDWIGCLPRTKDPANCRRVVVIGDFFTRFSSFFMDGVRDMYSARGIILRPVDLNDLFLYAGYDRVACAAAQWKMKPGYAAFAKACTRILQPDGQQYLRRWLSYRSQRRVEDRYRRIFQKSGCLVSNDGDTSSLFEEAARHVSPTIYGETVATVGKGLTAAREGYDGIMLIGPFNCLPYRISEAILKPLCNARGMPILTYESDGYAVEPSVLRQVDVHIQQVLERSHDDRRQDAEVEAILAPR